MTEKTFCIGSGYNASEFEHRRIAGSVFVQCPECDRILKPTGGEKLRQHQTKNKNTASLDSTREILWHGAAVQTRVHFAIGLSVYVRHGTLPVGWGDDLEDWKGFWDEGDYDRRWTIQSVGDDGSFEAAGWYWEPQDLTVAG